MRIWKDYFYYFFIILSCIFGAIFARKVDFLREITTLCYISVALFAVIETIIKNYLRFRNKLWLLRLLYLFLCATVSFFALHLPIDMLVLSELKCPAKSINIKNIDIRPKASGYLVDIKFQISYDKYLAIIHDAGLDQVSLSEIRPIGLKSCDMINRIRINGGEDVVCFSSHKDSNSKSAYGIKNSFYDKSTETAFYEHMNYKNKEN